MHQILVCASSQELPASLYDEKVESEPTFDELFIQIRNF